MMGYSTVFYMIVNYTTKKLFSFKAEVKLYTIWDYYIGEPKYRTTLGGIIPLYLLNYGIDIVRCYFYVYCVFMRFVIGLSLY